MSSVLHDTITLENKMVLWREVLWAVHQKRAGTCNDSCSVHFASFPEVERSCLPLGSCLGNLSGQKQPAAAGDEVHGCAGANSGWHSSNLKPNELAEKQSNAVWNWTSAWRHEKRAFLC